MWSGQSSVGNVTTNKTDKSKKKPNKLTDESTPMTANEKKQVRIVAIGASAGGLEPFERFFDAMPPDNGLAFVIIQHLSPNFKSMMDELLARHSGMAIKIIDEGSVIEPNTIYLNQARLVPTLSNAHFKLTDTSSSEDLNLPINTFFNSLAVERGANAIGVILSGTGSDGTKGCEAIKNVGGTVFVQEPTSAKFDGMPNSVINQRLADAIGPPETLAELVQSHAAGRRLDGSLLSDELKASPLEIIFKIVADRFGTDFRCYKKTTIERRIRRRSEMSGLGKLEDYAELLAGDMDEVSALYNDLLIDVTAFFRDPEAFSLIEKSVIPDVASRMSETRQVRIWVAGCSSGEEPYSIAMAFADYAKEHRLKLNLKILATDIHHRSLDAASAGIYPEGSMKAISSERIGRYFEKQGAYFHIRPEIRRLIVFTPHSLFRDPPFTRMDLVTCRNMLIYFKEPAQQKAMALFHFALNKDGYLFLGPSETIGRLNNEFETVDQRWRIYRKKRDVRLVESTTILRNENGKNAASSGARTLLPHTGARDLQVARPETRRAFNDALQSLLSQYAPSGFLMTRDGEIVHTFGDAGKFISIGEGGFSRRIVDLVQSDLKLAVAAGLERIKTNVSIPFKRRATMTLASDLVVGVTIGIECLPDSIGTVEYLLLTLEQDKDDAVHKPISADFIVEGEASIVLQDRIADLERDLLSTEESLQSTIEELETSNEELQATNEELMASNEELQSTNEELHSVNEELYTVSAEHQRKIEELTELTNDMDQLLQSTEIGTIFLGKDLQIRRFTPAATRTFNLMAQDISRPFSHVTHGFDTNVIEEMIAQVQQSGESMERELDLRGHSYLLRILPFKALDDDALEIVVTIIDIHDLKQATNRIAETADFYQGILTDIAEYVLRWRVSDGAVTYCNASYADLLGQTQAAITSKKALDLFPKEQHAALLATYDTLPPGQIAPLRTQQQLPNGSVITCEGSVRAIGGANGQVVEVQVTMRNATSEVKYLSALEALIEYSQQKDEKYEARIEQFLAASCIYFDLPHGILKRFDGTSMILEGYWGPEPDLYPERQMKAFDNDLCQQVVKAEKPIFLHSVGRSKYKGFSVVQKRECRTYIGAPVYIDGSLFGSVCFFSNDTARQKPFTNQERAFMMLLARWLGYKIERRSQLLAIEGKNDELQQANDGLSQFAYVASHDLQEPLRKIRQFSELLKESYSEGFDEDGRYFLNVVSDSAGRMSSLIRDLLAYSKTSNQALNSSFINLNDLVKTLEQELEIVIKNADASMTVDKLPTIEGDITMVSQLFTNLITNAIKYRQANVDPAVTIRSRKQSGRIKVSFSDNGIGMKSQYLDKIFEPFTRLNSNQTLNGSGIGLAICRSVCERHGWTISVDSAWGEGSTFTITMPV